MCSGVAVVHTGVGVGVGVGEWGLGAWPRIIAGAARHTGRRGGGYF